MPVRASSFSKASTIRNTADFVALYNALVLLTSKPEIDAILTI